jgi:hypothetical protein
MSINSDALDAFIAKVEALRDLNERTAKAAEKDIADANRRTARAATTPDGTAWAPLADGGKALEGAAAAITSSTSGNRVELKIGKPWVFHQHGGNSGKFHSPKRKIIPAVGDPVPKAMRDAIAKAAAKVFERVMGG